MISGFRSFLYSIIFFLLILGVLRAGDTAKSVTTVYLVRHAERDPGIDPPLNEAGRERALALKTVLADSGIGIICCPNLIRNIQTAEPLAEAENIRIMVLPDSLTYDRNALADYFIDQVLTAFQGQTILFIGNMSGLERGSLGNMYAIYKSFEGTGEPLTRHQDGYKIKILSDTTPVISHFTYGKQ